MDFLTKVINWHDQDSLNGHSYHKHGEYNSRANAECLSLDGYYIVTERIEYVGF